MRLSLSVLCVLLLLMGGCVFDFAFDEQCFEGDPCALVDGGIGSDTGGTTDGDVDAGTGGDDAGTSDGDAADTKDVKPPSPDRDDDGHLNEADICPDTADPAQLDTDQDGEGDECDPCPFVSGKATPCYGQAWASEQIAGLWRGFLVYTDGADTPFVTQPLALRLSSNGFWAYDEAGAASHPMIVGSGGLVQLREIALADAVQLDALLVATTDRASVVGNVYVPADSVDAPDKRGRMVPAGFVVLLRQHEGLEDDAVLPESADVAGRPAERQWSVRGWSQPTDGDLRGLQGRISTRLSGQTLDVSADSADTPSALYGFTLDPINGPTGVGEDGAPMLAFVGGQVEEHGAGATVTLGTGEQTITLTGALSFDRGMAALTGTSADGETIAVLMTEERLAADPDLRASAWALFGADPRAGLRGLIPKPAATDGIISLQLHRQLGGVAAAHSEAKHVELGTAGFVSIDQGKLDAPVAYSLDTGFIKDPRVCIHPVPGGQIGLMTVCPRIGLAQFDGCPTDRGCWVTMGAAVRLPAGAFGPTDYDLDGKGAESPDVANPCSAAAGDTCTCTLNPSGACPTAE